MILSIASRELKLLKDCEISRELWLKLESIYASKGPVIKATLFKQLTFYKIQENENVCKHKHLLSIILFIKSRSFLTLF